MSFVISPILIKYFRYKSSFLYNSKKYWKNRIMTSPMYQLDQFIYEKNSILQNSFYPNEWIHTIKKKHSILRPIDFLLSSESSNNITLTCSDMSDARRVGMLYTFFILPDSNQHRSTGRLYLNYD